MIISLLVVPLGALLVSHLPYLLFPSEYKTLTTTTFFSAIGMGTLAGVVPIWLQKQFPATWRAVGTAVYLIGMPVVLFFAIFILGLFTGLVRIGHI